MQGILAIIELILAIFLIVVVLLQQKGSGLGAGFGGTGGVVSTKRGIDKVLFHITIVTSILFFGLGLLSVTL